MSKNNLPFALLIFSSLWVVPAWSGDLDSPAAPSDTASAMYGVEDIYNRLDTGAAGSKRSGAFTEPTGGPGSTGHTLDEIMDKAPVADNTAGAAPGEVLSGKTYWGLRTGGTTWGLQTGTATAGADVAGADGVKSFTIPDGVYSGSTTATANDTDLLPGNIKNGIDLFGVTGTAIQATGSATDSQVLSGVSYSNTSGARTGAMTNVGAQSITPGTTAQAITQGYHNGSGSVAGDANLVTGNIKNGVTIFGVTGDPNVVDTTSGDAALGEILSGKKAWVDGAEVTGTASLSPYPALVPETGQTTQYDSNTPQADDGGANPSGVALPTNNRFTDHGDGTVTDDLTGLMWLKDANCPNATRPWQTALNDVVELNSSGTMNSQACVDYSGTPYTDWRLPTVRELQSLIDFAYFNPSLSNAAGTGKWTEGSAFSGVQTGYYWSSTTVAANTSVAWLGDLSYGYVGNTNKTNNYDVWPVRAGQ